MVGSLSVPKILLCEKGKLTLFPTKQGKIESSEGTFVFFLINSLQSKAKLNIGDFLKNFKPLKHDFNYTNNTCL